MERGNVLVIRKLGKSLVVKNNFKNMTKEELKNLTYLVLKFLAETDVKVSDPVAILIQKITDNLSN